jgi:hypothetical protein
MIYRFTGLGIIRRTADRVERIWVHLDLGFCFGSLGCFSADSDWMIHLHAFLFFLHIPSWEE